MRKSAIERKCEEAARKVTQAAVQMAHAQAAASAADARLSDSAVLHRAALAGYRAAVHQLGYARGLADGQEQGRRALLREQSVVPAPPAKSAARAKRRAR